MKSPGHVCTICQKEKLDQEDWFLMIESPWDDRLKVLQWNDIFATHQGVHAACSPAHVQELVAHWMATGSLAHPFARTNQRPAERLMGRRKPGWAAEMDKLNASGIRQLGELAVHREALNRILLQNPESLVSVLDALVSGLNNGQATEVAVEATEDQEDPTLVCTR